MDNGKITAFWFRRDLRPDDNHGLAEAMKSGLPVLPVFIFDTNIIDTLDKDDARITFIYEKLSAITTTSLAKEASGIYCKKGKPSAIWERIINEFDIDAVYANEDYEPYAIDRDAEIAGLLSRHGIKFKLFKDQVIFGKDEILKPDGNPYTVFTPYKNRWLSKFRQSTVTGGNPAGQWRANGFCHTGSGQVFPTLAELGFERSSLKIKDYVIDAGKLKKYKDTRDDPAADTTSYLSVHLRFGTVSIRKIIAQVSEYEPFLSELIWREFFMQILYHFPHAAHSNFKSIYDGIKWRNDEAEFERWKNGETGFPFVDAGMRQLNETGYMHNRARMIAASFLCKDLLIDWKWGEAYFAKKLLDYELSSNNGNWQWSAGTGCDAAPYFRIFNPASQLRKFDPEREYVKTWIPEFRSGTPHAYGYPAPMVDHDKARTRALETYRKAVSEHKKSY
ncbi:MAG: DNA photolyase family protein [Bacteroidales bacterium]|jgi:deoxyribodipyrimidine photo-lyase|nr:DNA photolyase family protein [Bacteroidales bacterium]